MTSDQAAWLVLALDGAAVVFTIALLAVGGLPRRSAAAFAIAALAWLAVLRLFLSRGEPFPEDISGIEFFIVVLAWVGIFGAAMLVNGKVRRSLTAMGQTWLLAPQGIRVFFGATFLLWAGDGILPRTFGIVDGLTHATAGFLGLLGAWAVGRDPDSRVLPWTANLFGLGDILIVASSIAFVLLDDIGPHHPMMYAVFGPAAMWLWFHLVSIFGLVNTSTRRESALASIPGGLIE